MLAVSKNKQKKCNETSVGLTGQMSNIGSQYAHIQLSNRSHLKLIPSSAAHNVIYLRRYMFTAKFNLTPYHKVMC